MTKGCILFMKRVQEFATSGDADKHFGKSLLKKALTDETGELVELNESRNHGLMYARFQVTDIVKGKVPNSKTIQNRKGWLSGIVTKLSRIESNLKLTVIEFGGTTELDIPLEVLSQFFIEEKPGLSIQDDHLVLNQSLNTGDVAHGTSHGAWPTGRSTAYPDFEIGTRGMEH